MAKSALVVLLALVGAAGFVFLVIALGRMARDHLGDQDRYTLALADIVCEPPPGQKKDEFLAEVQYLSNLPERLRLLDDDLKEQLTAAFARHPWVEKVQRVQVTPSGVIAHLRYRTPVLAVPLSGRLRAVDAHGILLPLAADTAGLPVFPGTAPPPAGPAGTPWGDSAIEKAAAHAANAE
jgi:hypothetical protein